MNVAIVIDLAMPCLAAVSDWPSQDDSLSGWAGWMLLAAVTFVAAAVNSVAGGGTILTFPILAAVLPADPARLVTANATSTIGLWPGALAAAWAYRGERTDQPLWARSLLLPSALGALVGALLVLILPPTWFDTLVPWLILSAATLFALQPTLSAWMANHSLRSPLHEPDATAQAPATRTVCLAWGMQFLVAVYGGYFGAGIGILMLAVLGSLGLGNIHKVNAVKNVLGTVINGSAALLFTLLSIAGRWWPHVEATAGLGDGAGAVSWPHVAVMGVSAVLGGLAGSHIARRLPAGVVRRGVAVIGFALAGYYFWA
jgi:uncharacterized membrane protein YfcA